MPSTISDVPEALVIDFDIVTDTALHADPQKRLTELFADDDRDIVYSPYNGGHWLITSYTMAHEILCDAKRFGSFPIGVPTNYTQRPRLIPLESDTEEHKKYRRLLNPVFAPDTVRGLEDAVRERTCTILDSALKDGEIDFLRDIAKPIPTQLFASQMGLDENHLDQFFEWERGFYRAPTEEERMACGQNIAAYLHDTVEQHKENHRDDIVGMLLEVEVDGERLTSDEVDAICYLLFLAGVDTVAAMLSFITLYIADKPDLWQRLREDHEFLKQSVDEFLRMHAFINLNRIVSEDMDFHGVRFRAGDNVVVPSYLTDRDPRAFPEPDDFNVERTARERNRHHAFGAGAHKCLGLHLAKLEIQVVLEELCRRVEAIELTDRSRVTAHGGTTMGLDCLPVTLKLAA
ncbi:MAG: cytochrome P450 [Pseudomonadota bacterium]